MDSNQRLWISRHSIKWISRLSLVGVGLGFAIAFMYLSYASPPLRQVKIAEIVSVTDPKGALIDDQKVETGSSIRSGQQLITQESARVGLQEVTGAARLGANSSLIVRNDCFQLGAGKAVISGSQGCIGAIVISSPTGIYTLERLGYLAEVKVLAGQVDLSIPSNPAIEAVSLQTNQKVTVNWTGDEVGPVRLMLPSEVTAIAQGELFQGFQVALPNQTKIAALQLPITPDPKPAIAVKPGPPPIPSAVPQVPIQPASSRAADHRLEDASEDFSKPDSSQVSAYPRSGRRRVAPNFSDERYVYRRRGRSPYASTYRRRSPSYAAPDYGNSRHEAPTHSSAAPPAKEHSHPVPEKPASPIIEAPLPPAPLPSVIEAPPTDPLPVVPESSIVVPVNQ
jgi:hypothetical protein